MNQNIGNSERREINISGMQQVKYMHFPKIWQPTFQLIGKTFCGASFFLRIYNYKMLVIEFLFPPGTYFTDMRMKMFLWVLGLLVLMSSTLMSEAFAVGLLQVSYHNVILVFLSQ